MGKLSYVLEQRYQDTLKADKERAHGFNNAGQIALSQVINQSVKKHTSDLEDAIAGMLAPLTAEIRKMDATDAKRDQLLRSAVDSVAKGITSEVSEAFDSMLSQLSSQEERILKAIKAIPKPKDPIAPEKVDLNSVLARIDALRDEIRKLESSIPAEFEVNMPEEEKKTQWTFEIQRNRAGFIERVVAS